MFYWRSDDPDGKGETLPDPPAEPQLPGPDFRPSWGLNPPRRPWDPRMGRWPEPRSSRGRRTPRPWYLAWLVSKNPPGFQWKEKGH